MSQNNRFPEPLSPIDMILDEENDENIILYNENNEPTEFEQIAVVPLDGKAHVILKPADPIDGLGDDEALVFTIDEYEGEECLSIALDDDLIDAVFEAYYDMLRAEGIDVD